MEVEITDAVFENLKLFHALVGLSVDIHNLNSSIQKKCGVSLVQWMILARVVVQPGISAGSLATDSGVHPSTLTQTISRLDSQGYIYIQDRPSDLRRRMLLASRTGVEKNTQCEKYLRTLVNGVAEIDNTHRRAQSLRGITNDLLIMARKVD
jgi:DNA-binding MarR family transcriptional regulator